MPPKRHVAEDNVDVLGLRTRKAFVALNRGADIETINGEYGVGSKLADQDLAQGGPARFRKMNED